MIGKQIDREREIERGRSTDTYVYVAVAVNTNKVSTNEIRSARPSDKNSG